MNLAEAMKGRREDSAAHAGWWTQHTEGSCTFRVPDILVIALILGFGALQFVHVERAGDFYHDDVLSIPDY